MFTYDTLTLNTFNAQKDLTENTVHHHGADVGSVVASTTVAVKFW